MRGKVFLFALLCLLVAVVPATAQDELPPAEISNDEGGAAIIEGEAPYTVTFLPDWGTPSITVALIDISAEIDRVANLPDYVIPQDAQLIGQITSDPLVSPFTYTIHLPIVPRGVFRDLDNDSNDDTGVITMSVQVYTDIFDDPYWESDREYSVGLSSTRYSTDFELRDEIIGGTVVVWSPDNAQGFPSGPGEDGLIFTDDDPTVRLPQGYTIVNMDTDPFTFSRAFKSQIDLIEQDQSLQPADYSDLNYLEAFEALIDQMRREYSFTELKDIDFAALYDEFLPRFEEAEANNDARAFQTALADYIMSFPDGHVGPSIFPLTQQTLIEQTDSSPGIAIRELDDGRVIVNYVVEGSPAEAEGIELGAEITSVNGTPIQDYLPTVETFGNFSTDHNRRLQELRYGLRFERGSTVTLTYRNPDDSGTTTVTLDTVPERETWFFSSNNAGAAPSWELPVQFEILDSGYGYARINTFGRDPLLAIRLWEEMIDTLNQQNVPGLIIDMRWNGGGYNLDRVYAGYFFQEEVVIGIDELYYTDVDDFVIDPNAIEVIQPPADGRFYGGPVAVLVSPSCASACEFFTYNMSLNDRAAIVGQYPTAGLGGNITRVFLPDGLVMQFTIGRALDADGNIRLEGIGVTPTVDVPVTEETLLSDDDVILQYGVDYLNEANNIATGTGESATIELGDEVTGSLDVGERVRYTVEVPPNVNQIDILLTEGAVVYLYVPGDDTPVLDPITEPAVISGASGATIIVEVGGTDDNVAIDYAVTVREAQPPEFEVDPTEVTEAGTINVGDSIEGTLSVGNRDQYTLEITEDATLTIAVEGASDAVDTVVRVYVDDEETASLVNDDRATGQVGSELSGVEVTAGQTLVIEVAGFGDAINGDYTLTVNAE